MVADTMQERMSALGFPVFEANARDAANITLAQVVESNDVRLWEGFPVMLANSIEKDWFDYQETRARIQSTTSLAVFDAMVLMSLALYDVMGLHFAEAFSLRHLVQTVAEKDVRYFREKIEQNENFLLADKTMSGERLRTIFSTYRGEAHPPLAELVILKDQADLQYALAQIFSQKQRELVVKRLKGEKFTKTEREYYSRTIRKKIQALANPDLHRLCRTLR